MQPQKEKIMNNKCWRHCSYNNISRQDTTDAFTHAWITEGREEKTHWYGRWKMHHIYSLFIYYCNRVSIINGKSADLIWAFHWIKSNEQLFADVLRVSIHRDHVQLIKIIVVQFHLAFMWQNDVQMIFILPMIDFILLNMWACHWDMLHVAYYIYRISLMRAGVKIEMKMNDSLVANREWDDGTNNNRTM